MHGMCGNARKYIPEPGEWLDTATLTRCDEAHQNGGRPAAIVASEERPVAASDCDIAIGPLGRAVVDLQVTILEKSRQCLPLIERIPHRASRWTLRQDLVLDLEQVFVQLHHHRRRESLA